MTVAELIDLLRKEDQTANAYFGTDISGGGIIPVGELIRSLKKESKNRPDMAWLEKPSLMDGTIRCSNKKHYAYKADKYIHWYIVLPSDM